MGWEMVGRYYANTSDHLDVATIPRENPVDFAPWPRGLRQKNQHWRSADGVRVWPEELGYWMEIGREGLRRKVLRQRRQNQSRLN